MSPALFVAFGLGVAAVSIMLATIGDGPYLSLDRLSPWLVTYAIGLFTALFASPFAIHRRLGGLLEADARWERSLLWWGALASATLALALVVGLGAGFDSESLAGSLALVTAVESGLVLGTLAIWLLTG